MANKPGRPTKLTPETKHRLFEALKRGAYLETACQAAGVDYRTVHEWIERGEGNHPVRPQTPEYAQFAHELKQTIADAEMALISTIRVDPSWQSKAWLLERRHPERWANKQRVTVEVEKQVESELNLLFEKIADDPTIPAETKQRIIDHACNLQGRAEVARSN